MAKIKLEHFNGIGGQIRYRCPYVFPNGNPCVFDHYEIQGVVDHMDFHKNEEPSGVRRQRPANDTRPSSLVTPEGKPISFRDKPEGFDFE